RRVSVAAFAAAICALVFTSLGAAADSPNQVADSDLQPKSTKFGHPQTPHAEARTIQHWAGETTNPVDGATYSYIMVGTDPATVRSPVTIEVPAEFGVLMTSRGGTTFADIDQTWFQPQVEGLTASLHYLQPHRLALFLTNDVMLYGNHNPMACCVFGAHGTT